MDRNLNLLSIAGAQQRRFVEWGQTMSPEQIERARNSLSTVTGKDFGDAAPCELAYALERSQVGGFSGFMAEAKGLQVGEEVAGIHHYTSHGGGHYGIIDTIHYGMVWIRKSDGSREMFHAAYVNRLTDGEQYHYRQIVAAQHCHA